MEFNTKDIIIYSTLVILVILVIYILVRLKTNHENFDVNNNNISAITNLGTIAAQIMNTTTGTLTMPADNTIFNGNANITGSLTATSFNLLPTGLIVAWNNAGSIPSGWILCDGTSNTPDLRGKFILGAGQGVGLTNRNLTDTGGEETHVLTIPEMPSHTHGYQQAYGALFLKAGSDGGSNVNLQQTEATGGGGPHNNMPPFYVLVYIMKL